MVCRHLFEVAKPLFVDQGQVCAVNPKRPRLRRSTIAVLSTYFRVLDRWLLFEVAEPLCATPCATLVAFLLQLHYG